MALACALALASACNNVAPPDNSFYDERVAPVLQGGCVQQTTGCHIADDQGRAVGNVDLSSFDGLMRRRDLLPAYGPYPEGLLLLKAGTPVDIAVDTWDADSGYLSEIRTDIRHNAGSGIALESSGFGQIKRWIESGFARSGVPDETVVENRGACFHDIGTGPDFDASVDPTDTASWSAFAQVNGVLHRRCAGGSCHASTIADLRLTCGETPQEKRWNYWVSLQHLTTPASTSGLLRRPLSQLRGGSFHEGGSVFASTDDPDYQILLSWAEDIAARTPEVLRGHTDDPGLAFFANRVQPVLVRKGCMFLNCHSSAMFHDLRYRGGSTGFFSRIATRHNYDITRTFLALQSADPADSRLIAKNLFPAKDVPSGEGLPHRGGPLLEDFGGSAGGLNPATPDDCAGYDADAGDLNDVPAYCVIARWLEIERGQAIARGEIFDAATPVTALYWVARPPGIGDVRDFDTFRGGADLRRADLSLDADGAPSLGVSESMLAGCGIAAGADVRGPAVSWNGQRVAFAARASAGVPLRLYWMNADGSACERVPGVAPAMAMENGVLTHDFDPAWAPDGRLVFASTRGNIRGDFPYSGPTRTPAEMQPNSNLYVFTPDSGDVRQLTYLLNQEVAPNFLGDGRVIFSSEKRAPGFHQLALRRENLDGGDYHPLYAQRPSVGFSMASEVAEVANRDFVFIASDFGAQDGAGAVVVVNRSLGPDQDDRDPADRFFIHSMRVLAPGAFGTIPGVPTGAGSRGVFRSPAALPGSHMIVSCDVSATDVTSGPFVFDLCSLNLHTGAVTTLGGEAGMSNVEAAAVFARPNEGVFQSRVDEANAHTRVDPDATDAVIHVSDFPLLATLVFSNTRIGRPINHDIGGFDVLESLPPDTSAITFADVSDHVETDDFGMYFRNYELRGHAGLLPDGSTKIRINGGMPMVLRPTDADGNTFTFPDGAVLSGDVVQREEMQFYPGERSNQSMQRRFFNGLCGGCHGAISDRELDVAVNVDVLTGASQTLAHDSDPIDLRR